MGMVKRMKEFALNTTAAIVVPVTLAIGSYVGLCGGLGLYQNNQQDNHSFSSFYQSLLEEEQTKTVQGIDVATYEHINEKHLMNYMYREASYDLALSVLPPELLQGFSDRGCYLAFIDSSDMLQISTDFHYKVSEDERICGLFEVNDYSGQPLAILLDGTCDNTPGSSLLHEFGHFLDNEMSQISSNDDFIRIYREEAPKINSTYFGKNPSEFFAQTFFAIQMEDSGIDLDSPEYKELSPFFSQYYIYDILDNCPKACDYVRTVRDNYIHNGPTLQIDPDVTFIDASTSVIKTVTNHFKYDYGLGL